MARTTGIDMAATDRNTAACVLDWSDGGAEVVEEGEEVPDLPGPHGG